MHLDYVYLQLQNEGSRSKVGQPNVKCGELPKQYKNALKSRADPSKKHFLLVVKHILNWLKGGKLMVNGLDHFTSLPFKWVMGGTSQGSRAHVYNLHVL